MPSSTRSAISSRAEVADAAQHVVQPVAAGRARELGAALQVVLDALERARVDQLAQLLLAEQLAQQVAVQRQRGRAALGAGRVALVHVGGDVVEQQRGRRTARRSAVSTSTSADLARVQAAQQLLAGPARRARRAGTRGRSRARSGSPRSGAPPRAGSGPSGAAATAACAGRGRRAGSAARARRSRESARRTARRAAELGGDRPSTSSGSISTSSRAPAGSASPPPSASRSGRCRTMPSSDQIASASRPKRSRMRAESASPHAAWTRPPKGESTHRRQSPISSRKRSSTIVRSLGSTRVAACCSRR